MSSAISRARDAALQGAGKYEGEWLDNDTLIANQLVFLITDVSDDRGGGFNGQDRWVLRVEPFYEDSSDPDGLISMTDNPARRKFMSVLDEELNSLLQSGKDPVIGPCVMVRLKGKNYRYNDIVDWDEQNGKPVLPQGAVMAGARVEDDMPPRRPRRGAPTSEPAPQQEEAQRPFAGAVAAEEAVAPDHTDVSLRHRVDYKRTEQGIERVAPPAQPPFPTARPTTASASDHSASTRKAASSASPSPTADPPSLVEFARDHYGYRRGRIPNAAKEGYEKFLAGLDPQSGSRGSSEHPPAPSPSSASGHEAKPYQGSAEDVEREIAIRAARNAVPAPADVPVGAPNRAMIPGHDDGLRAQEIKFRAGMSGTSIEACPACGKKVHDRIFPIGEPGANSYALVHARCEAGGEQMMMPAIPDAAAPSA
jgi:hypothetical protein